MHVEIFFARVCSCKALFFQIPPGMLPPGMLLQGNLLSIIEDGRGQCSRISVGSSREPSFFLLARSLLECTE